jgi:predicted  nucleic acid-binding Zn-ribbon protein
VQNTHELQALTKEVDQLKAAQTKLQEEAVKSQSELTQLNEKRAAADKQLVAKREERTEREEASRGQTAKLQDQAARLEKERATTATGVEARILAMYNRVRGAKGGVGISPAAAGRCQACNMMIAPQAFNELQKGTSFHQCSTCHRFLYIPPKKG